MTHIKYSGAGVLLINGYDILLVKDYNKLFNVPGGKVDQGESLEQSASRELYEETRTVYDINVNLIKRLQSFKIETEIPDQYFKVYVFREPYIPNTTQRFRNIDTSRMSKHYKETSEMLRFPIIEIKKIFKNNPRPDYLLAKVDGQLKERKIHGRCRRVLRTAINKQII